MENEFQIWKEKANEIKHKMSEKSGTNGNINYFSYFY
jgi:hypothetical protein